MGKHRAAVVIAGALLAAACGASKSATPATTPAHPGVTLTTPTTLRAPATSTTTSTPAYSFDDSVPPPKLINTGTDYVAILKSLEAYGNWLAAHHPDPALAANVAAVGTREYELFSRDLSRLRDNHRRAIEILGGPSRYTILSAKPDAFSARAVEDIRDHKAIAPDGHITSQVHYTQPTTYSILAVSSNGHWLLAAQDVQ